MKRFVKTTVLVLLGIIAIAFEFHAPLQGWANRKIAMAPARHAATNSQPPASCPNVAGALPFSKLAAGTFDSTTPIQHIVVIMQENHSIDSQLGALTLTNPVTHARPTYSLPIPGQPEGPTTFDGINPGSLKSNADAGCTVAQQHFPSTCPATDPAHDWNSAHVDWNNGLNDQFYAVNGDTDIMGYFTATDLPYYYWLADQFAIGDRYFCSVLGPTWPNRSYLYAGTSFGITATGQDIEVDNTPTVFDYFTESDSNTIAKQIRVSLKQQNISYPATQPLLKYYTDASGPCASTTDGDYIQQLYPSKKYPCAGGSDQFVKDVQSGNLAPVSFVDSDASETSEHPTENVQEGQVFSAKVINAILASNAKTGYWWNTAVLLTYDENGGFYDHVAPPSACEPDSYTPKGGADGDAFNTYGFRVPVVAISAYAKRHYVSHVVYDHTSILRFIETKFNLPALTRRDANASPLMDMFDFSQKPKAPPGPGPATPVVDCPFDVPDIPGCE